MFSQALKSLWSGMLHVIDALVATLGEPPALTARGIIPRQEGMVMRDMLRVAEYLLRRLLFLAAIDLKLPEPAYALPPLPPLPRSPRPAQTYFRFTTSTSRSNSRRANPNPLPIAAEPLARRLQALLAIIEAPRGSIQRLARRLKRKDGRELAQKIAGPLPAFKTDPNHDYFDEVAPACDAEIRKRWPNSS